MWFALYVVYTCAFNVFKEAKGIHTERATPELTSYGIIFGVCKL